MARRFGRTLAIALLATALGCSNDDGNGYGGGDGTCVPTAQTSPDPDGARAFCLGLFDAICERGFSDCVAELDLAGSFADVDDCKAQLGAACWGDFSTEWYDGSCGASCLAYARSAPCSVFEGPEPQACAQATGTLVGPPPACVATIGAGTREDTITAGDPLYDGGRARAYCLALSAGQGVSVWTDAPTTGTPLPDTVLHLLRPDGAELAYDDDSGTGLFSSLSATAPVTGTYVVVVRGYSSSYVGSYQLGVAIF